MHSGLYFPDGSKSSAYYEVKELSEELKKFDEIEECPSSVAIIFDYGANFAWNSATWSKLTIFQSNFWFL